MNYLRHMFMLMSFAFVTQAHAQNAIQQLRSFVSQHQAFSGEFVQTTQGKAGQQTGSFAIAKPSKFRWAMKKPFEQLLLSDGKTLTQWDADLNQATVRNAEGLLANTPIALLLGGAEVDKFFTLADAGTTDGLQWVSATPKGTDTQFKQIKLGFKDALPVQLHIQDAFGGNSQVLFKNVSTAAVIASQFSFTPPKGADVIKM